MKIKNFFSGLKTKISSLYSKNKKLFILTMVLILVLLVSFLFYPKSKAKSSKNSVNENLAVKRDDSSDYSKQLETKLEQMLLSLGEVKKASVMVVCESSVSYDYLKNRKETTSGSGDNISKTIDEEVAYEKNGSASTPIIISTIMPKIVGVWVIINSVSASTKLAITNSISSVLNLDETSISILQER